MLFGVRRGDILSGDQVLAILDDYPGTLRENGEPITREWLERTGRLEAFRHMDFQYQDAPSCLLSTSQQVSVMLDAPVVARHRTHGDMLLVGPALSLLPGLAMGQRLLSPWMIDRLLGKAGVEHGKWLSAQYEERQAKIRLDAELQSQSGNLQRSSLHLAI